MAVATEWPGDDEYYLAVQDPRNFTSTRLQAAVIADNEVGILQHATGASAIVFQATMGSADVALRCFTRSVPSQRERYRTFARHLTANGQSAPACFVRFTYLDEEILVDGSRYPLVEMGWADGSALHHWVAAHCQQSDRLRTLAGTWLTAMNDLYGRKIAHGDLANDNCLVASESAITLIDYDGCYVPDLEHADPREDGHADFRHPRRAGYYGPNMDAFPALVIYLSLLAVSTDATLWKFHKSDDHLLFTAKDYERPGETPVWRRLLGSQDQTVVDLTRTLADMCTASVEKLPPLGRVIARYARQPWPPPPPGPGSGTDGRQPPKADQVKPVAPPGAGTDGGRPVRNDGAVPRPAVRPVVERDGRWWDQDQAIDDLGWDWSALSSSPPPDPGSDPGAPGKVTGERRRKADDAEDRTRTEPDWSRQPQPKPSTKEPPPSPPPPGRPRNWFQRVFGRLSRRSRHNP